MLKSFRSLCLLVLFGLMTLSSFNQEIEIDTTVVAIDEVTITAARIPENIRQFARLAKIISRKDIEASPAHDLAELLEYLPDIDVRQRGPFGVQSDISMRGGTFDQFVVLVNGINFSDPQTGHFQMDIPIPLSMIQRIEVLSGSDVKSLGSNAYTGAINIVTRDPVEKVVQARLFGGQNGFIEAGIDASRQRTWSQQAGVLLQKSDGYRENTDFKNLKGFFQTGFHRRHVNLSLMLGGLKKDFGANSFYSAKYPGQFERTGSGFTAFQADFSGKINIRQSIYYRLHSDEFTLFRTHPPAWYTAPNFHLSQTSGIKSDAWFRTKLGKTAFGFEYRREVIWSTVLGEPSVNTGPFAGMAGVEYTHYGWRNHFSLSAEQQAITGPVKWNGGVVLHQMQSARKHLQVYPGLDISYSASPSYKAFLSFNRAFRLPSFTELYYQSPTNQGNDLLLPETAWHAEVGNEIRLGGFSGRLTGFYRYASQSIDWVRTGDEIVWHTENLGKIRTSGIESGLTYTPGAQRGLMKVVDQIELGYRHYFQNHSVDSYFSLYVLDYLKWKFTSGMILKIGERFRFSAKMIWQKRNGSYSSFNSSQEIIEVDYEPFMVMDIKVSYRLNWIQLVAECTNVFNQEYFDLGSIPQPGIWFQAGAEIRLVGKQR